MTVGTRIYLAAFVLSNVGVSGFTLATGLLLFADTGSAGVFGALVAVEFGLGLGGQVLGGSTLDRMDVLTAAVRANTVRSALIIVGGLAALASSEVWPVAVPFLVASVIRPIYRAASFALVARVCPAEDLPRVNALRFGLLQVGQGGGLLLVAGLVAVAPLEIAFTAVGVVLALATVLLAQLRRYATQGFGPAGGATGERPSLRQNWVELGRLLRRVPSLGPHLLLGCAAPLVAAALTVFVAPVNAALHGGSLGIVALDGGAAVGALAAVVLARRQRPAALPRGVPIGLVTMALGLLVLAGSADIRLAAVAFVIANAGAALTAVCLDSLLQLRTDRELLGRVSICQEFTLTMVALPLLPLAGAPPGPDRFETSAMLFAGLVLLFLLVWALGRQRYRAGLLSAPATLREPA